MDLTNFQLFKQGAEAKLYTGTFLGEDVVVKERFSKKYRHPVLDTQLTKDRHKAEVRALLRCKQIGVCVPTMYLCDNITTTIIMQNIGNSITARDFINNMLEQNNKSELSKLAMLIGETVAKMHCNGLIHGDITTSNILVKRADTDASINLVMIDFGLSFQEGVAEDKGVDLYVLERAFLSTHPNTEDIFGEILEAYKKKAGKQAGEVFKKFEDIRLRGRKRTMVG
eukprot:GFUD01001224.1.p1 GENE.GFUD01001224.1~~GFUD01001224.1.p1  ORF type:complete len:226 (-),score=80.49 GFUD01001224.1:120-797(-)